MYQLYRNQSDTSVLLVCPGLLKDAVSEIIIACFHSGQINVANQSIKSNPWCLYYKYTSL